MQKVGDQWIMQAVPAAQAVLAVIQDHPPVVIAVYSTDEKEL